MKKSKMEFVTNQDLIKYFNKIVIEDPEKKAIKYNETILTYKDLDTLINKIANLIKGKLEKIQSIDSNSKTYLNKRE